MVHAVADDDHAKAWREFGEDRATTFSMVMA